MIVAGSELALIIANHGRQRDLRIVSEEQASAAFHQIGEQQRLFIDDQFRVAIVAHGDGHMDPRNSWDQIAGEHHRASGHVDLSQHQAWRVTRTVVKPKPIAEGWRSLGGR